MMCEIKSCENCSGKYNGCYLKNRITVDIEGETEFNLEEGELDEYIKEHINLKNLFIHMRNKGIIKENQDIQELVDDNEIMGIIREEISEHMWDFIRSLVSDLEPEIELDKDEDFYCKDWR